MIERRALESLGGSELGWLDTKHHFSFASYHDPERMNWGALRVWNDDSIAPGTGFPTHSHSDMEIITYVREGAITHRDNMGNQGRTQAGDVQVMSAGTGVRHSEYNLEPGVARIFQIWIMPCEHGELPSWGTKSFPKLESAGKFVILASGLESDKDALPIRANARVLGAMIRAGESLEYQFISEHRHGYMVLTSGKAEVNGVALNARDGAAIQGELKILITAQEDTELVLVDATSVVP